MLVQNRLKIFILFGSLFLFSFASAQLRIGLQMDRSVYLMYEPINITIIIENNSGNTLTFAAGDPQSGIYPQLLNERNEPVFLLSTVKEQLQNRPLNIGEGLILPAGAQKQLNFTLNRFFNISVEGNYTFYLEIAHARLPAGFRSKTEYIRVVNGIPLITKQFGVHTPENNIIYPRTASLLTFHEKGKAQYALRVEDEKFVYAVIRLGERSQADRPQLEIDARSFIHLLIQIEPKRFMYTVTDENGKIQQTAFYRVVNKDSIPSLLKDPQIARVMVVGGELELPGEEEEVVLPVYTGVE